MTASSTTTGPPPELRFRRRVGFRSAVRDLWRARELVRSLAEREYRSRYKQAALGAAWALITPLVLMVIFTLLFKRVARIDTQGAPYPLFVYVGLLPWTFFSTALAQGGLSLVNNVQLLNKVYCPREVFPIAFVVVAAVDTAIALVALGVLFVTTGYAPRATSVYVPVMLVVQVAFTVGVTMVVSAVTVYFKDLRHGLPILLQLGLLATPVAYGIDVIPSSLRWVYSTLNPLGPVIDGYRRTVLFGQPPDWALLLPAATTATAVLLGGYLLFKRIETGLADVA